MARQPPPERTAPYRATIDTQDPSVHTKGLLLNLSKHKISAIAAVALFSFVFLTAEFRFDTNMGELAGPDSVVGAQGLILGASVIGFVVWGLMARADRVKPLLVLSAAVSLLGVLALELTGDPAVLQIVGCLGFLALGLLGAAAHTAFAQSFEHDPKLATGAGAAYAAGILLQFAVNLVVPGGIVEGVMLSAATVVLARCGAIDLVDEAKDGLLREAGEGPRNDTEHPCPTTTSKPQPLKQALWSIALVFILACMFSTLDNVVTLSNAHGTIAVQTWPRLFLAASGLAAGVLFDLADRRYMGFLMFGVTALSTITILAVEAGADANIGLIVFYLSCGFFVTFFTATFTQLAPRMQVPALWAGMGRAANNVCAFTTSGISFTLVTSGNVALIMIGALVLLVAAGAAFLAAGLFRPPQTEQEREHQRMAEEALAAPSVEEQRQAFIADHGLTPREVDVLMAVTQDERPLKQIAEELGISMRMVQRHLSSIYQKTDTQTRAGLTKAFPSL